MSTTSQADNLREVRLFSRGTVTLSPIILSGSQALSLLSPLNEAPKIGHSKRLHTLFTYARTPLPQHAELKCGKENYKQKESPIDVDLYYDQDTFKLPPVPTYNESQAAYHPYGVKKLPHFHPQKFSRRLRTLMDQRRRPQPLMLNVEPEPKSYFSPSPTPIDTSTSLDSQFQSSILRVLPNRYNRVTRDEEASGDYDEEVSKGYDEEIYSEFWSSIDHRIVIMGIVGLLLLSFGLGAWVMAMMSS